MIPARKGVERNRRSLGVRSGEDVYYYNIAAEYRKGEKRSCRRIKRFKAIDSFIFLGSSSLSRAACQKHTSSASSLVCRASHHFPSPGLRSGLGRLHPAFTSARARVQGVSAWEYWRYCYLCGIAKRVFRVRAARRRGKTIAKPLCSSLRSRANTTRFTFLSLPPHPPVP